MCQLVKTSNSYEFVKTVNITLLVFLSIQYKRLRSTFQFIKHHRDLLGLFYVLFEGMEHEPALRGLTNRVRMFS